MNLGALFFIPLCMWLGAIVINAFYLRVRVKKLYNNEICPNCSKPLHNGHRYISGFLFNIYTKIK